MIRALLSLVFFLVAWGLSASPVAALVSLEGEVTVLRDGRLIPSEKVGEGFLVEGFDTVTTGATGRTEIRLSSSTGLSGVVKLDPDTSLYLELSSFKKEQKAGVELLTGAVTVKLSGVAGASLVEVRTEVGTFGGTGPAFRVVLGPAGDALVVTSGGRVQCFVENRTTFLEPGTVAEALALGSIRTHPVNVSTVESYEASWVRQRRQVFNDQSEVFFRTLAPRYQLQSGLFQRAWDRIQRESKDDPQGASVAVANLRRAAFPLERSVFRIQALAQLLEEGILNPSLELSRGYLAKDFLHQASQEKDPLNRRLAEARSLYRHQSDLHEGDFPKASDGAMVTYESAFFH